MSEGNGNGKHGGPAILNTRSGPLLNQEEFQARVQQHVLNMTSMRAEFLRRSMTADPRRNLESDCGYPEGTVIDPWFFRDLYDREPVATRVVELMPKECWQVQPTVSEDEDAEDDTPFEADWEGLSKQLRGDSSWFQDSEGSPVFEYLYRVDKLSGIGTFGVLLLGFDDGKALNEPVEGMVTDKPTSKETRNQYSIPRVDPAELAYAEQFFNKTEGKPLTVNVSRPPVENFNPSSGGSMLNGGSFHTVESMAASQFVGVQYAPPEFPSKTPKPPGMKLVFLRPFDQTLVQVTQWESNILSPRFGQAVMYRITLYDPREASSGIGMPMATVQVHWTRVLHFADNLNSSETIGVPRIRPVLNPVLDIRKIRGGGAEGYWKSCIPGVVLSTHPQLGGDVPMDIPSMKDMMENFFNSSQRDLILSGMDAKTLAPAAVDPTTYVNVMIEAICIQLGCPVRIFRGSERGELASSQDDSSWNDRLRCRQNGYLTPRVIVPFVDRLVMCGILSKPVKGRDKPLKAKPKAAPPVPPPGQPPPGGGKPPAFAKNHYGQPYRNAEEQAKADEGAAQDESAKTGKSVAEVKGGYSVKWPDLDSLGEKDKATIAQGYTTALAAFISGGCENAMGFKDYLVHVWEMDEETAQNIIDNAIRNQEEQLDAHADLAEKADGQDLQKTPPVGFENKPEPPPPMPGMPGGPPLPPPSPFTVRPGDKAVHPQTGRTIAQGNPPPKPAGAVAQLHAKRPTKNAEDEGEGDWITFRGQHFLVKDGEIQSGHLKGQKMDDVSKKAEPKRERGNKAARDIIEGVFPGLKVKEGYKADAIDRAMFAAARSVKSAFASVASKIGRKVGLTSNERAVLWDAVKDLYERDEAWQGHQVRNQAVTVTLAGDHELTFPVVFNQEELIANDEGWVTLESGQRVFISGGEIHPGGPPAKSDSHIPKEIPNHVPQPIPASSSGGKTREQSHAKVTGVLDRGGANSKGVSAEKVAEYKKTAHEVLGNMPDAAIHALSENLGHARFHADTKSVGQSILEGGRVSASIEKGLKAGTMRVGGFYRSSTRLVALDGPLNSTLDQKGIYAHELTHAIDGPNHSISGSREWSQAFTKELGKGQLTRYGASSPTEGLAEFGRLMYTGTPHRELRERFPECFRVFESRGLASRTVGNQELVMNAKNELYPDVFNTRIDLGDGSYADAFDDEKATTNSADEMENMSLEQLEEYLKSLEGEDLDEDDGELQDEAEDAMTENCGGEGSGVPGPCPSGSSQEGGGHTEKLHAISDRFTKTDELSHADMKGQVDAILAGLKGKELKALAEEFNVSSAKGREGRVEAIKRSMQDRREMFKRTQNPTGNVYCATGEGGGIDPSCSPTDTGPSTFKEHFEESQKGDLTAYPRSMADAFATGLKSKSKDEIKAMAKEAGVPLFSSSKSGMIGEIHSALTASHRAFEKVEA